MAVCILKAFVDGFWYFAFAAPFFFGASSAVSALLAVIPCAWALWLFLNRGKRDFAADSRDTFFFQMKLLAVVAAPELLFMGISRWQRECGLFVLAFFVLGILLLRVCRLSEAGEVQAAFWGFSGVQLVLLLLAAAVCSSSAVRNGLITGLGMSYQKFALPVLEGLLWLLIKALEALAPLFSALFPNVKKMEGNDMSAVIDGELGMEFEEMAAVEIPAVLKAAGFILLILAAAGLMFLLYRRIAGLERAGAKEQAGVIQKSRSELAKSGDNGWRFAGERDVRYYYRKFLRLCRKKGMEMEPSTTSEAVYGMALGYWNEDRLKEFQMLYQKARYGSVSRDREGEKRAKELYRLLKDETRS